MYCTNCGKLLNQDENFCSKCGTPVKKEENRVDTFNFNPPNNNQNLQNNANNNINYNQQVNQQNFNQTGMVQSSNNIQNKKKSNGFFIFLVIVFILIIISLLTFIGFNLYKKYIFNSNTSSTSTSNKNTSATNTESNNKVEFYEYEFVVPDNLKYKAVDNVPVFGNTNEIIAIAGISNEYSYSDFTNDLNINIDSIKKLISDENDKVEYVSNSEKVYNNRKIAVYKFNYIKDNESLNIDIAVTTLDDDSIILSLISVKDVMYEDDAYNNFSLIAASGKISEAKSFSENSKDIKENYKVLPNITNANF